MRREGHWSGYDALVGEKFVRKTRETRFFFKSMSKIQKGTRGLSVKCAADELSTPINSGGLPVR